MEMPSTKHTLFLPKWMAAVLLLYLHTFPQAVYVNNGRKTIFLTPGHLLSSIWIEVQMAHLLAHSKT